MLLYFLIGLCLSLVGFSGMLLAYMFYLDRVDRERRRLIQTLESKCKYLTDRLDAAESMIAKGKPTVIDSRLDLVASEEKWADVISEN